jgi:hypothetical protein
MFEKLRTSKGSLDVAIKNQMKMILIPFFKNTQNIQAIIF